MTAREFGGPGQCSLTSPGSCFTKRRSTNAVRIASSKLPGDWNEIGNQVERHSQIRDQGGYEELAASSGAAGTNPGKW
jgi:hypothetical protein